MKFMDINQKRQKCKKNSFICSVVLYSLMMLGGCGKETQQTMAENTEETQETVITNENTQTLENSTVDSTQTIEDNAIDKEEVNDNRISEKEVSMIEESDESEIENEISEQGKKKPERVKVKGIYVSGPVAGTQKMDELIELVDSTELNALVIDIKNDEGRVTYKMQTDTVLQIEAGIDYITDIKSLVAKCKEKNIYLIARIVAFKDPYLAEKCPELAIKTKNGEVFHDKKGLAWVNPYSHEVWDYLIEVATEAANAGFDEIQFDYIRFSTDLKTDKLDFGAEAGNKSKIDIITEFTNYAYHQLSPLGVYVAADVYGTIIDSKIDQDIVGQDYVQMAANLDYICPMVYPSHYANGVYGISIPDAQPYETVNAAMNSATKELSVLPEENRAINRVWIQSFTATWVDGHISYGPQQIRDQIHGAYDAGYDEWILWNAAVKYQKDSLLTDEEAEAERIHWDEEKTED